MLPPVGQMGIGNFPERGSVAADRDGRIFASYGKTRPKRAILDAGMNFYCDSVPDSFRNCLLDTGARSSNPIAVIIVGIFCTSGGAALHTLAVETSLRKRGRPLAKKRRLAGRFSRVSATDHSSSGKFSSTAGFAMRRLFSSPAGRRIPMLALGRNRRRIRLFIPRSWTSP